MGLGLFWFVGESLGFSVGVGSIVGVGLMFSSITFIVE